MVILILERVPAGLRGELSRWMIEPRTGVFVGNVSALVRDKLWEKIGQQRSGGSATLLHSARNEQGFLVRTVGDPYRKPYDCEGLTLVRVPGATERRRRDPEAAGDDISDGKM